jgi:hypothetical protein
MNNNLIQIEKGKYTALLRRVLGMHMSENGTSEIEAILNVICSTAQIARNSYAYGATAKEIDGDMENIGFALEYYNVCKEDLFGPDIQEQEYPKVVGKINLGKNVVEDDCDDCV